MKAVLDTRFFIASLESKNVDFRKWSKATLDTLERKANLGMVPSIVVLELYKIQLENSVRMLQKLELIPFSN